MLESTFAAQEFRKRLDDQVAMKRADCLVILRNIDLEESRERMRWAADIMHMGYANIAIGPHELNTKAEADVAMTLATTNNWKRMYILTSQYHHYRAFLTFLRTMEEAHPRIDLISVPLKDFKGAHDVNVELAKIREYQGKGHIATYEEGIAYLKKQPH